MPRLFLTPNLKRHVGADGFDVPAGTLRESLAAAFAQCPALRSYVVEDHGGLRKHMNVFIDNVAIVDRETLGEPVGENSEIWIFQALSGG